MKIRHISSGGVHAIWPRIAGLVEKGCNSSDGELRPENIEALTKAGILRLFVAQDGGNVHMVAFIRVERWQYEIVARIVMMAGWNVKEVISHFDEFKKAIADTGAKSLIYEGRIGWLRLLPEFRMKRVVAEIRL